MADPNRTILENCACPQCQEFTDYTSNLGSYSCTSNLDKTHAHHSHFHAPLVYPTTLFVMRHSERVDDLFPGWTKKANDNGKYKAYDMNMPSILPIDRCLSDFDMDTPITNTGVILAMMIGRGLKMCAYTPDIIYCSPALRCMQTAYYAKKLSRSKARIRVEPGLFENLNLYKSKPILANQKQREIFEIDESYRPIYDFNEICAASENNGDYNKRVRDTLKRLSEIPQSHKNNELNVLIVAHASSVDMAVGSLREQPRITNDANLYRIGSRIPYCSTVCLQRTPNSRAWQPLLGAIPPISYQNYTNKFEVPFVTRT